ncbi:MAG TPA: hypothetical protein V6D05_16325 [Stenomitos sp.]
MRPAHRTRRRVWGVAIALLLGCAPITGVREPLCVPSYEALLVLSDLSAGLGPSRLKETTPTPSRRLIAYQVQGRPYQGDLYRLEAAPQAGIVLVAGAAEKGKDDPRLVALAYTLARVRFAVLVPDLKDMRELKVRPSDIQEVADAFSYLADQPELSPGGRAGIGAHSYSVGPALLAAMEPRLRDRVRFVQGVGGYYDTTNVVTFFTTGWFRENAAQPWRYMEPNTYGKWVFALSNVDLVRPPDRDLLTRMAVRRIKDPKAPIADLADKLGPEGRSVYDLLANTDPNRVSTLIMRLPADIRSAMAVLDLSTRDFSTLHARLILIHGEDDNIIPYTESLHLDHAVPPGQARLYLIHGLRHVELHGLGLFDAWRLACAVEALLAERRLGAP